MHAVPVSDPAVARVLANEAIRDLLSRYCFAVDAGDFDAMAALFAADTGSIDGGVVGFHQGRPAIADAFRALTASTPTTWSHLMGNIVITHTDSGTAEVESAFHGVQQEPGGPVVLGAAGRYSDQVAAIDGAWQFVSRVIHLDLIG